MPDFLQKDTAHDVQPEAEKVSAFTRPLFSRRPSEKKTEEKKEKAAEKAKKKPSRLFTEYYGVLFLLLIASFIVAGFVLLRPLILEFKTATATVQTTVQTLNDEREYLASLQRSIAAAESIPPDVLERVDEAIPRAVGIPKLLETMAKLAEDQHVTLNSIQFAVPKGSPAQATTAGAPARDLTATPLDVSLTMASPGYAATRAFLKSLEDNLRVLDVQTITVTGNEQTGEMNYTVQLRTYTLQSPQMPTTNSQPPVVSR